MQKKLNSRRIIPTILIGCFLCTLGSRASLGDLPRPPKPTPQDNPSPAKNDPAQLLVRVDEDAKTARLIIPQSVLKSLAGQPKAHADARFSPASTVVAGIAMSSALVCGGLLLARGRNRRGMLLGAAIVCTIGIIATIASADLAPFPGTHPPIPNPQVPRPGEDVKPSTDIMIPVVIEAGRDGPIRLTISREEAARLLAGSVPPTNPAPSAPPAPAGH